MREHIAEALLTYAVIGLPIGLVTGLALGLVAQRDGGWGGYGSFRRRAARLGHISCVMLPLLAGFYALSLRPDPIDTAAGRWGARLWIAGGVTLPLALFAAAWRPALRVAMPVPALTVLGAAVAFAVAYLGS